MSDPQEMPRNNSVHTRIREFVLASFPLARQSPPQDDDSLLDSGIVDSLGILELVEFLTGSFGIVIDDQDLNPDDFRSISSLTEFVQRKIA